jgi:type IV secretion system protein VirB8
VNVETPAAEHRRKYYADAESWAGDGQARLRGTARTAWMVAGAAATVAVLEALALVVMMPLKRVEPYTIVVDRNTGYIESSAGLKPGLLTQDAAVTEANLVSYVTARETFDAADLKQNFRKVQLLSNGDARDQYLKDMSAQNPSSPLKLYPATTVVQTVIKSVSLLNPQTALVRFDTVRRDGGGTAGDMRPWSAVIQFRYSGAPMRMGDRFVNPLGFQVTHYRRDGETTGSMPTPPSLVPRP